MSVTNNTTSSITIALVHVLCAEARHLLLSIATSARRGAVMAWELCPRSQARSHKSAVRWSTRIVPIFVLGVIVYGCWATTKPICIDFFIARHEYGRAIAFLVLHYLFLILMLVCYARTLQTVSFNPGLVPLEPKLRLESFYTRDVYACRSDGLPIWCSECQNWKPDRVHHSGEIQRCVKKMDHYCPWAGGMIGETSFKFFIQFATYAACYGIVCLSAAAYVTSRLARAGAAISVPAIVEMALAGFFGLFAFTMAVRSHGFALSNLTTVEDLSRGSKAIQLAIRIPLNQTPNPGNPSKAIDYATITYPLADPNFDGNQYIYENNTASGNRPAEHKFAIVTTDVGDNPWDTGSHYTNWTSVMGDRGPVDWLLPLRLSPCCDYGGAYPVGPVVAKLRERLNEGSE